MQKFLTTITLKSVKIAHLLSSEKNTLKITAKLAAAETVERLEAANSKERLETWKFAAEEIVDLLNTVRQEGEGGTYNILFRVTSDLHVTSHI